MPRKLLGAVSLIVPRETAAGGRATFTVQFDHYAPAPPNGGPSDPKHYVKDREVKEFVEAHPEVFTYWIILAASA